MTDSQSPLQRGKALKKSDLKKVVLKETANANGEERTSWVETTRNFHIIHHVLIDHKLFQMRKPSTHTKEFNRLLKEIAMLMAYEVTKDFPTRPASIDIKDVGVVNGRVIRDRKAVLVPILRGGLVMVEGINDITASSKMGHIGLHRDRKNNQIIEYLVQLPVAESRTFILVDPMIGTGDTACRAIELLRINGTADEDIKFVTLIASQRGMEIVQAYAPKVQFYAAAVDPELSEDGYTVPGLGYTSTSKRLFGTP